MQYTLIRARKHSLSLQVTLSGEVVARAPLFMPKFLIDRFVKDKTGWVEKRLAELSKPLIPLTKYFTESALKKLIESEVQRYSEQMKLYPSGLRYTHVKTYWGTCATSGVLSFNLALCYTPKEAVIYVIVHELSHLRWKGHGTRFWDLVKKTYPKTNEMRALLRHTKYGDSNHE